VLNKNIWKHLEINSEVFLIGKSLKRSAFIEIKPFVSLFKTHLLEILGNIWKCQRHQGFPTETLGNG
jgi:hypothetical protein